MVGIDPNADPDPTDADTPCGGDVADWSVSQEQLTSLGDELANHILAIDEAHYGETGDAGASDDALVVLAYNAFDDMFYDCEVTTYTAGYFAPEFLTDVRHERHGHRHLRLGEPPRRPDGQPGR